MNTDEASGSGTGRPVTPPNIRFNYHEIGRKSPILLGSTSRPTSTPPDVPGAHASNPESPTAPEPATTEAFQIAIHAYINDRLPGDAKKDFQSASDIMETPQMRLVHRSGSGNTMHISSSVSDRVKKILESLRHFTGSVAICVQHSPEISSLIIGGVNCILMVSTSSFTCFYWCTWCLWLLTLKTAYSLLWVILSSLELLQKCWNASEVRFLICLNIVIVPSKVRKEYKRLFQSILLCMD